MNEDKYYMISNSDGDVYITECSKETLEERINEEYYGNVGFIDKLKGFDDTNYWGNNILIIKVKIVVPKDEKVVIRKSIE